MKRILTLLVVIILSIQSFAQTSTMRRPLWAGLDMGGTWQSSDMKALGGIGWSFTLSRYSRLDAPGILWWGWRFRYFDGNNFGYNYHPLFGVENDPVLNGSQNPMVNYSNGQQPNGEKYIFSNYKFHFDEFAYELMIGSQGLRRHGVLLYAFGGAGLTHYKVKTNQLDQLNNMYDYSDVPQTGNDADVKDALRSKWDFTYETVKTAGKWGFMPSAGIGMGYQWGNGVALGVEHRTTWALTDAIDGVNYSTEGAGTRNGNDLYNYDGLFVRWTFGGHGNSTTSRDNPPPPPNPNSYSQNTTTNPTTTTTTTTTTTNTNNNPNNNPNNITYYPPTVQFTTPSVNPYSTSVVTQQLVVNVTHVQYSSQISLMINNVYSNNFSFNPNTNTMVFTYNLLPGTNYFVVTANNQYGSASDSQTINYTTSTSNNTPTGLPPQVTISSPNTDPYNSSTQTYSVVATVLNVAAASDIQVLGNSASVTNFSYNAATHQVSFVASLNTGANLYEVIGTNTYGSASDAVTINYNPVAALQPPVVTITSPTACPFTTKTSTATVTANITNITAANQVAITFNNQAVTVFSFVPNATFATVSFVATLTAGTNPFTITGTNTAGTDSKSCSIIYKNQAPAATPPVVNITNPASTPYTSSVQTMVLTATVLNVASQAEIQVNYNNANTSNFQYDMNSHVLTYNATFNTGNNYFTVTAANANGSDSKSATIIYQPVAAPQPPTVVITTPGTNPYATAIATQTVIAQVTNITSSSQITVTGSPNQPANFVFNAAAQTVTFTATLSEGMNQYTVTGTNAVGSASDNETIKYVKPVGDNGSTNDPNTSGNSTTGPTSTQVQTTHSGGQNATSTSGIDNSSTSTAVAITLVNPSSSSSTSSVSNPSVSMHTTGVIASTDISVKVNGLHLVNFTYEPSTGNVSFTPTLIEGANVIEVKVINNNGAAIKQEYITYTAPTTSGGNDRTSGGGRGSGSSAISTTSSGTTTSGSSSGSTTSGSSGSSGSTSGTTTTTHPKGNDNSSSGSTTTTTSSGSSGSSTTTTPRSTSGTTTTTTTTTSGSSSAASSDGRGSSGGGTSRGSGTTTTTSGTTVQPR